MNMRTTAAALVLLCAGACLAQPSTDPKTDTPAVESGKTDKKTDTLKVGDAAPKLAIAKWMKGEAVDGFKPGQTYVVEFWATWCPPCRDSIPHLTELQTKLKDKKVTIIGVSSEKSETVVKKFVDKMGDKMEYVVAFDDKNKTNKAYMEAAGEEGIPAAFVVDGTGKIAWIGHPMDGLDAVVEKVAAGTYDVKKAEEEAKAKLERAKKLRPLMEEFTTAYQGQEWENALKAIDKAMAVDAEAMAPMAMYKYQILALELKQGDKAKAWAREAIDGPIKGNAQILNAISWTMLDEAPAEAKDLALAKKAAEKANELTKGKDPAIMDTYARALFESGEIDKAVQVQTKAVELAPEGEMKDELKGRLEEYRKKTSKT